MKTVTGYVVLVNVKLVNVNKGITDFKSKDSVGKHRLSSPQQENWVVDRNK